MAQAQQDWRLRVDVTDAAELHDRLRDAHRVERELEPLIGPHVVLSCDENTLFAYADSREAIDEARRAIEHELAGDQQTATLAVSHWDDDLGEYGDWHQVDPPETGAERAHEAAERKEHERDGRVETRTVAVTSGKWVRNWFETTVADEARDSGVELSIVEHPHLLTTQIAFTLTGPTTDVDAVVADLRERAMKVTRLELNPLAER